MKKWAAITLKSIKEEHSVIIQKINQNLNAIFESQAASHKKVLDRARRSDGTYDEQYFNDTLSQQYEEVKRKILTYTIEANNLLDFRFQNLVITIDKTNHFLRHSSEKHNQNLE